MSMSETPSLYSAPYCVHRNIATNAKLYLLLLVYYESNCNNSMCLHMLCVAQDYYVAICVCMLHANSLGHGIYFLLRQIINDTLYSTEGLHGLGIVILLYYVMKYGQTI